MGNYTCICIYAKKTADPLHESMQTGWHQETNPNSVGRSKAKEDVQIPRPDDKHDKYETALERSYRGEKTKGNEDGSRTQLPGGI